MRLIHNDRAIEYAFNKNNVHIKDSYLITNKEDMRVILGEIRLEAARQCHFYDRNTNSWLNEWCAHNRLYKLGIAKKRTGSVDFCETEHWLKRFAYTILAIGY